MLNWISSVAIICVDMWIVGFFLVKGIYVDYTDGVAEYLFTIFDLNFIYAIRVINLLKIYLINFKNNYLPMNSTQNCDDVFKMYKTILSTYELFNKIFNVTVIF